MHSPVPISCSIPDFQVIAEGLKYLWYFVSSSFNGTVCCHVFSILSSKNPLVPLNFLFPPFAALTYLFQTSKKPALLKSFDIIQLLLLIPSSLSDQKLFCDHFHSHCLLSSNSQPLPSDDSE